jgi:hypothetical protein
MTIKIPVTVEIIQQIQKQYAYIVAEDVKRINDPNNKSIVYKIISEIQNKLNEFAKQIYDKHGRIVIKVGPGDLDYLDITSPRIDITKTKATVYFLETDRKGIPIGNPTELL